MRATSVHANTCTPYAWALALASTVLFDVAVSQKEDATVSLA